ncbi:MAG: UbiX family flavin prenyltransferase [Candidatus Thermoplasmatota archaeon]|nr:UbiX family flavin prenyltransferase [Candidatus Thermoplasmatota archaeon]
MKEKFVIGVTGGSGSILALTLLRNLENFETHLVLSDGARKVFKEEMGTTGEELLQLASYTYDDKDISARISSGSFKFNAAVIIPCSISTLGKIASGISDTLVTRASAVALKERRRLILVPREMPLSTIVLENMHKLSLAGAIIAPASPGYYTKPRTVEDMVNFVVSRVLDLMGVDNSLIRRWRSGEK